MDVQITQPLDDNMVVAPDATFATTHEVPVVLPDGHEVWGRVTAMEPTDDRHGLIMTVDMPEHTIPLIEADPGEVSIGWGT